MGTHGHKLIEPCLPTKKLENGRSVTLGLDDELINTLAELSQQSLVLLQGLLSLLGQLGCLLSLPL